MASSRNPLGSPPLRGSSDEESDCLEKTQKQQLRVRSSGEDGTTSRRTMFATHYWTPEVDERKRSHVIVDLLIKSIIIKGRGFPTPPLVWCRIAAWLAVSTFAVGVSSDIYYDDLDSDQSITIRYRVDIAI